MDLLRVALFAAAALLALLAAAVCAALRDRAGMALMFGVFVLLAWIGKRMFMSS